MSEEDFFDFVCDRDEKWELISGEAVMMAGTNQRQRAIVANILTSLHTQLREKKCRPTASDTGVSTSTGTVRYPDVVVDCGSRHDQAMLAKEPRCVIEVMSPFGQVFDSHRKLFEYKAMPEISYVLLVDATNVSTLLHFRDGGAWAVKVHSDIEEAIDFSEIGATLALSDIYDGIAVELGLARTATCSSCR